MITPPRPTALNTLSAEGAIGWAKSRITEARSRTETRSHKIRTSRNTCMLCTVKISSGRRQQPAGLRIQDDFQERKSCSSRASWSRLGPILGHLGGHLGSDICAPVHAGVCLVKNHVFDVDKLSRHVLDRTWPILEAKSAENDPKLAPQDEPKSSKNRVQKMIKILI